MAGALVANRRVRQRRAGGANRPRWRELQKSTPISSACIDPAGRTRPPTGLRRSIRSHLRPPRADHRTKNVGETVETIDQISTPASSSRASRAAAVGRRGGNAQSRSNQFAGAEDVKLHAVEIVRNAGAGVLRGGAAEREGLVAHEHRRARRALGRQDGAVAEGQARRRRADVGGQRVVGPRQHQDERVVVHGQPRARHRLSQHARPPLRRRRVRRAAQISPRARLLTDPPARRAGTLGGTPSTGSRSVW